MSAVSTPAGMQSGAQQGQFWSQEQQRGESAGSRSVSLGATSHQSLQKLESGLLPQVFSTRDSFDPPGTFASIPRTQEERSPVQAALAAQAITAQVRQAVLVGGARSSIVGFLACRMQPTLWLWCQKSMPIALS